MNLKKIYLLLCAAATAVTSAYATDGLVVHSGGTLTVHTNVRVNSSGFRVESGGTVNVDLGSTITATNIVYGGTLTVASTNVSLASGQSFQLFNAPTYSGAFVNVNLPSLASGLGWSSKLSINGTVSIHTTSTSIAFSTVTFSSTQMTLSGTGGTPNGTYVVLTSTNLSTATASWTVVATNTCTSLGAFSFSYPVSTNTPRQFFVLQVP